MLTNIFTIFFYKLNKFLKVNSTQYKRQIYLCKEALLVVISKLRLTPFINSLFTKVSSHSTTSI